MGLFAHSACVFGLADCLPETLDADAALAPPTQLAPASADRHWLPGAHVIALEGAPHRSSALAHAAEKSTGDVRGGLHGWSPSVGDFSAFHFSQICRASASQSDSPWRSALPEHANIASNDAIAAPRTVLCRLCN